MTEDGRLLASLTSIEYRGYALGPSVVVDDRPVVGEREIAGERRP